MAKRAYDPDKHCGAKSKSAGGTPCTLPKGFGTNHVGTGRCKFHGGASTGAKTPEGKRKVKEASIKHGFFSSALTGSIKGYYDEAALLETGEATLDVLRVKLARLKSLLTTDEISGDSTFARQSRKLMAGINASIEEGEFTQDFADEVRMRLTGLTPQMLAQFAQTIANLETSVAHFQGLRDAKRQLAIATDFLVFATKNTDDKAIKLEGLAAIQKMKAEAGLPADKLSKILNQLVEEEESPPESEESPDDLDDEQESDTGSDESLDENLVELDEEDRELDDPPRQYDAEGREVVEEGGGDRPESDNPWEE